MWNWRERWRRPGGSREVLAFSYPLILSQMTFTLQTFIDRVLLTWYAPEAMAAATTSLFLTQVGILMCAGTGQYTTTFVAQFLGAGRRERVGAVMWQGIIAVYSIFDMMNAIFAAALRGAGDTTFPLAVAVVASWTVMIVPTYVACVQLDGGLIAAWSFASLAFVIIGLAMLVRYRAGRWRELRVIEPSVATPELVGCTASDGRDTSSCTPPAPGPPDQRGISHPGSRCGSPRS